VEAIYYIRAREEEMIMLTLGLAKAKCHEKKKIFHPVSLRVRIRTDKIRRRSEGRTRTINC
jgi:hypothetical protein